MLPFIKTNDTVIQDYLVFGGHYMKGNHNTLLDQLEELGINSIINVAGGIDYPTTIHYRKFTWDDCSIPLFKFCKTNNVESNKTYLSRRTTRTHT